MAESTIGNASISLSDSLGFLKDFGFFEVVVPLILIFAVFYGILLQTKIFGAPDDKTTPLYAIISFVSAFLVIASTDVVQMINEIIPSASLLLVITVLILMMLGMFGVTFHEKDFLKDGIGWWGKLGVFILIIVFLGVIDMSMEKVEIPVIHDIASGFVDDGDSGSGSGSSSGSSTDNIDVEYYVNLAIILALMVGLPIATIYFIVHKPKSE